MEFPLQVVILSLKPTARRAPAGVASAIEALQSEPIQGPDYSPVLSAHVRLVYQRLFSRRS